MYNHSGFHGPTPDDIRLAPRAAKPTENSALHLLQATQAVHHAVIESQTAPRARDLQDLNRVLDAMESHGHLVPGDAQGYHKAYRQFADFARTYVQADIMQRLPKPPHWAPKYPDVQRIEKHLRNLLAFATGLFEQTPETERNEPVPFVYVDDLNGIVRTPATEICTL